MKIIVMTLDKTSVKLFKASITIEMDPAIKPIVALKPTKTMLANIPTRLVLTIVCSLVAFFIVFLFYNKNINSIIIT